MQIPYNYYFVDSTLGVRICLTLPKSLVVYILEFGDISTGHVSFLAFGRVAEWARGAVGYHQIPAQIHFRLGPGRRSAHNFARFELMGRVYHKLSLTLFIHLKYFLGSALGKTSRPPLLVW